MPHITTPGTSHETTHTPQVHRLTWNSGLLLERGRWVEYPTVAGASSFDNASVLGFAAVRWSRKLLGSAGVLCVVKYDDPLL